MSVAYGSAYGTLPTPVRDGYTFLGWYTASSGGTQVTASTVMEKFNTTVYAQWKVSLQVIVKGNMGGEGGWLYWTNNTGKTIKVYYTLECLSGDYSQLWINYPETVFATNILGYDPVSGTINVENGDSIYYYNAPDSHHYAYLYYYN